MDTRIEDRQQVTYTYDISILSSNIRVFTVRQRSRTLLSFSWPRNLPASFFASSFPIPIPAHECSVVPPIFTAAIPVDAVIARPGLPLPPHASMMARSRTDFPVPTKTQLSFGMRMLSLPADPVKKTFSPLLTISSTVLCSSDRAT